MTDWIYEWEKPCTPYFNASFLNVFMKLKPPLGLTCDTLIIARDHKTSMYFGEETLEKAAIDLKSRIVKDPNFMRKFSEITEKFILRLHTTGARSLKSDADFFEEYFDDYWHVSLPVGTIRHFNRIAIKECNEWLSKKYKTPSEISEALSILAGTSKISFSQKEQESFEDLLLFSIKENTLDDPRLDKMIAKHVEQFGWFPCGYENEPSWDEAHVKKELENALTEPDKILLRLKSAREYPARLQKERFDLIKKLNPPKYIMKMFDALSEFTYYKDHIRENLNRFHFYTRPFLQKVSEAIGLKDLECTEILPLEVVRLLKEKKEFKGTLLGHQDYTLKFENGVYELLIGSKAVKLHEKITIPLSTNIIKGIPASVGVARGRVKLVFRPRHYLGEKDIVLVAPMTNPDLVPAMRNAVAIVTDEGGITCHAAIISRELHIPCIVGTKDATKILKDGDLVEVDANNGTVKVLG